MNSEFIIKDGPCKEYHASTLVHTPTGLLAAFFGGSGEHNSDVCIWTSKRVDSVWTDPRIVARGIGPDHQEYCCWNPVLFRTSSGVTYLFYKVGPNPNAWWGMMKRSSDDGASWSEAEHLPSGILGPIKNKPIELPNGTILCPSSSQDTGWKIHVETFRNGVWSRSSPLCDGKSFQAIQPTALYYPPSRIELLSRTAQGVIGANISNDLGGTWSEMCSTTLPNPNSGIDGIVHSSGIAYLAYNHATVAPRTVLGPRTPLCVAIRTTPDNAWEPLCTLEDSDGEYSYPAIIELPGGMIAISYTFNRTSLKVVYLRP